MADKFILSLEFSRYNVYLYIIYNILFNEKKIGLMPPGARVIWYVCRCRAPVQWSTGARAKAGYVRMSPCSAGVRRMSPRRAIRA